MHEPPGRNVQGHLLIIGGGEERSGDMQVLNRFIELAGGKDQAIVVVTAATKMPDQVWGQYQSAFAELGATSLTHVHVKSPNEGASERLLAPLRAAKGILMTGGAQKRLMGMLRDTPLAQEMRNAFAQRGACVAGTSAGASAMSRLMLAESKAELEPEKGAVALESGLGFLTRVVIDQHFSQRGRLPRLLSVIAEHADLYGVGIDENTALVVCPGAGFEVVGEGGITLVDGRTMLSNITEIKKHESPRLIDLRLHLLPAGTRFNAHATEGPELVPAQLKDFFDALIQRNQAI